MKIINKITIVVLGSGATLEVITGTDLSSAVNSLNDASKEVSKVTKTKKVLE